MLIGFVGLPNSGKTTIAAKVFSALKEISSPSELIVEQARFYIANKRVKAGMSIKDKLILDDEDQLKIIGAQNRIEKIMVEGCDKMTYIVSDSSILNALLYVSEEMYNNQEFKNEVLTEASRYDLIIYCHPFDSDEYQSDPNRVHSKEEVDKLHNRAKDLLGLIKKKAINTQEILGNFPLDFRWKESLSTITNEHLKYVQTVEL